MSKNIIASFFGSLLLGISTSMWTTLNLDLVWRLFVLPLILAGAWTTLLAGALEIWDRRELKRLGKRDRLLEAINGLLKCIDFPMLHEKDMDAASAYLMDELGQMGVNLIETPEIMKDPEAARSFVLVLRVMKLHIKNGNRPRALETIQAFVEDPKAFKAGESNEC